ncbi:MAG: hypothetical protein HKN00_10945 [Flavobacteriaceae bacterium]|nr:hypothetical protein [Bacteroidia bacterium]MBT8288785.1 hypothetical protein [Bacteroidia bacterium]NNF75695.1 hypothetical protein [Flavobacteriaceae bacterium]NNK74325.1 hypothetical protein [Flavobacteriaceae bacterium]
MILQHEVLEKISTQIDQIFSRIDLFEAKYEDEINRVHPNYKESARNLIHYLALRSFNITTLDNEWQELGIPISTQIEGQILQNLVGLRLIVSKLLQNQDFDYKSGYITHEEAQMLIKRHSAALFGDKPRKRSVRIMVTQPNSAAEQPEFVQTLIDLGMNVARINCAHDDEMIWKSIVDHIRSYNQDCKIAMDLGGPKIRTGSMKPGPKVIHIKPNKNELGQVIRPAKIWLAPYGIIPAGNVEYDAAVPVNKKWLNKTKAGSYIIFMDARNKKCRFTIESSEGIGRWASCSDSAFVTSDTLLNVFLEKKSQVEIHTVHELLPLEEVIFLFEGDLLRLDRSPIPGEPALKDESGNVTQIAHISCTEPQIFPDIKENDLVFFNDGKIEGIVKAVHNDHALIEITTTKKKGGKLRAGKGINFPNSVLNINGLTEKDRVDLKFIAKHADMVNFSFVNSREDVLDLLQALKELQADIGIILKIETLEAYKNLPSILLTAMQNYPVGVMIARGDLAIETGWKKFAIIQEEMLSICEAAHIPNIWATQVLENLAKKGVPTRSEITDAAMAQRAECVMLNKGYYINKAVRMLDKILCEMQQIQKKKKKLSPKLQFNPIV